MSSLDIESNNSLVFIFNANSRSLFLSREGNFKNANFCFFSNQVVYWDTSILEEFQKRNISIVA